MDIDENRIDDAVLALLYLTRDAVQRSAGTGDTRWNEPGVLDCSTGISNPRVDVAQDATTLYASDRDVFLFLVDDLNPIEAGRLRTARRTWSSAASEPGT